MRKSKTDKFIDEAKSLADQAVKWLNDRVEEAPDMGDIKDAVGDKTKDTVESLRDRMEDMASWLGEVADNMTSAVIDPPPESRGKKAAAAVAAGAVVVGGLYYLNPTHGKTRRARVKAYFADLKDRLMGRIDSDTNVFADGSGDLRTVDSDNVAGIAGAEEETISGTKG